jgi:diacylglycerol kinase (ATP)
MTRALVVTNADAGSNDADSLDEAMSALRAAGFDVEVVATSAPDELDDVLARRDGRTVVVAGGDGSLHAVVGALHRRGDLAEAVVGLIPLGTGNDFARGVGLPRDPAMAARTVVAGRTTAHDLLVDDDREVVVNAVHAGVGAAAGRRAEPWKARLGNVGYAVGAVLAGIRTRGHRLSIETDGRVVADGRRHVLQVAVGTAPYVGGGTELAPHADPGDGRVDVVVSFAVSPLARLRYAVLLRMGRHLDDTDVVNLRATRVRVFGESFWCNADGELTGPFDSRTWTVEPGTLRLLVP